MNISFFLLIYFIGDNMSNKIAEVVKKESNLKEKTNKQQNEKISEVVKNEVKNQKK